MFSLLVGSNLMLNAFRNLHSPEKTSFSLRGVCLGRGVGGEGGGGPVDRNNDQLLNFWHLQHGQVSLKTDI